LLACCIVQCWGANLYAVVTEFSGNEEQTRVYTVLLNRNTGRVTNVTANFVYTGGSGSIDGLSGFDQINGRYYFATDDATAFIYGTDIKNKMPLPTLDIGAESIDHLVFNSLDNRLYTIFTAKTGTYLAAVGPQTFRPIAQVPSQYNAKYLMIGAVDGRTGTYYLVGKIGPTPVSTYGIATIKLQNGQILRQVAIDTKTCTLFPEYLWFDSATGNLMGGGEAVVNGTLVYYFIKVSPATGTCTKTVLQTLRGIVSCWSYDPTARQLWFVEATGSGAFLESYNVETGQKTTPVLLSNNLLPESLEVAINF